MKGWKKSGVAFLKISLRKQKGTKERPGRDVLMLSGLLMPGQLPAKAHLVPHTVHVKKPFNLWNQSQAKDKIKKGETALLLHLKIN